MRVTRLRPGLIFQEEAGPEIRDYFLGSFVPRSPLRFLGTRGLMLLPWPDGVVTQAVHAEDIADAYWRVIQHQAGGAFNVASEPVVGPDAIGTTLGSRRWISLPVPLVRALAAISYRLRLQPTDPGWIDMAVATPVMSTRAIREATGWTPQHSSLEALGAVVSTLHGTGGLGNAEHRSRSPLE